MITCEKGFSISIGTDWTTSFCSCGDTFFFAPLPAGISALGPNVDAQPVGCLFSSPQICSGLPVVTQTYWELEIHRDFGPFADARAISIDGTAHLQATYVVNPGVPGLCNSVQGEVKVTATNLLAYSGPFAINGIGEAPLNLNGVIAVTGTLPAGMTTTVTLRLQCLSSGLPALSNAIFTITGVAP